MDKYPTIDDVKKADRVQLARWHRFLPSPGMGALDSPDFEAVMEHEVKIMERIMSRFRTKGGMTPEISKRIDAEREGSR